MSAIFSHPARQCELADVFPFEFIESEFLIGHSGTISAGFSLSSAPHAGSMSEDALNGLHYSLVQALQSLPVSTIVQKTDIFSETPFVAGHERDPNGFLGKRWAAHYHYRPALTHSSFLFITFKGVGASAKNALNSSFSKGRYFRNPLDNLASLMQVAVPALAAFVSSVSMISELKLDRLGDAALKDCVISYFNLAFDKNPKASASEPYKSLSNKPQGFKIGVELISMISMTGQGPEVSSSVPDRFNVHTGMLSPILAELGFAHIVTQSVCICDTQAELRKLDVMRSMLHSLSGQRDQDGEIQESGLQTLSAEIRKHGHELVKLSLQVCLYNSDPQILTRRTDEALTALKSIQGIRACIESYDTANLFFASVPGNGAENYRWILMPAVNAACYINFLKFFSSDTSGLLLCDRYRQPVYVNFWNEGLDNKNKLIIGPSGSGKSFTVNSFITQHCHDGDQVVIIDVGGSYKGLFQIISGKYFEYSSGRPLRFNPFLCEKNNQNQFCPGQEKINFLLSLVAVLWKDSGEQLAKTEKAVLSRHILRYYETSPRPGMNSFFVFLVHIQANEPASPFLDLSALLVILADYTREGTRPYLLNSTEEIDIGQQSLVCFDMNGIKEDATLFPVVSLLIIDVVLTKIRLYPARRKHIYMDEAWSMLKDTLGDFVMNMFRTIRKANGAITIITQGIDEIEQSPVGIAILQNAATKILLDHSSATQFYETLRISLGLTTHEMDLLRSLRKNEAENWREFFVKFGSEARVFMLDAPHEARIAFDSRIQTREKLRLMTVATGGNTELAIDEIIEQEGLST